MKHWYSKETIESIWQKAKLVDGYNPNIWRKDFAGAWIRHDSYGAYNEYGWEIDHKKPDVIGGNDSIENLWPLHWKNNQCKGDMYPNFKTCITSKGNNNIEKEQSWTWKKNQ